jgi:hypothetical protein
MYRIEVDLLRKGSERDLFALAFHGLASRYYVGSVPICVDVRQMRHVHISPTVVSREKIGLPTNHVDTILSCLLPLYRTPNCLFTRQVELASVSGRVSYKRYISFYWLFMGGQSSSSRVCSDVFSLCLLFSPFPPFPRELK